MANMLKVLVLTMAVLGSAVAQPVPANEALSALATSPQAVALASDPKVYEALLKAFEPPAAPVTSAVGADGRALAGFCEGYVDLYNPECERCNHSGCGWFQCSAFTKWEACKPGWSVCGYESCVGGLCTSKPTCGRKPASSIRGA